MSDTTRHLYQYGVQASNTDFTSTPGTLKFLRPAEDIIPRPFYEPIPRPYQTGNGEKIPDLRGRQIVEQPDASFEMEGLSAGGAGDGVDASTLDTSLSEALEATIGGLQDGVGELTDAVDAGTGASVITDAPSVTVAGGGVLVEGTISGRLIAREAVSVAGDTITIDQPLTDMTGAADTAAESTVIGAARSFYFDNEDHDRAHLFWQSELENSERKFFGSLPGNASISIPVDGTVKLGLTGQMFTSWEDVAESGATYVPPTTGSPIVGTEACVWIDGVLYMAYDLSLDFGLVVSPRRSQCSDNGHLGQVWKTSQPVLTGTLRAGVLTSPAEVTDTQAQLFLGADKNSAPTVDLGVQVGHELGSALYIRMPNARINLEQTDDDGLQVYSLTATATESSNHTNVPGACRVHIF